MKDDPDHGFRVCVNALINKCLKPYASTVPLATDEIKKLSGYNYFLQVDVRESEFFAVATVQTQFLAGTVSNSNQHCMYTVATY